MAPERHVRSLRISHLDCQEEAKPQGPSPKPQGPSPPPSSYFDREGLSYPLFLDPSITGIRANWTTVYKKYPNSSFYDGANYNEDTKEARVGFERDTWGTARSFFRFKLKYAIKGADVSSATMKILETHSWSCSKRTMQVWQTGSFGSEK